MDSSCQTPGMFIPYSHYPFSTLLPGTPSPPQSLCSEPIFQIPMPDGRCGSPGVHVKGPKMQLLNKTVVDARRKKNSQTPRGINTTSCPEPANKGSFFRSHESLSSMSEFSENVDGGINGVPMSPLFNYGNTLYPQAKTTSTQYLQAFKSPQFQQQPPQCHQPQNYIQYHEQQDGQRKVQTSNVLINQNNAVVNQQIQSNFLPRPPSWGHLPAAKQSQITSTQNALCMDTQTTTDEHSSKTKGKVKRNESKKGLISTLKDNVRKVHRKQRKKIQEKNKSLHKTELCTHWTLTSTCSFEDKCYFAHGIKELKKRVRVGNFKSQPCVDCPRDHSQCKFGSRCNYCHPGEAIRKALGSSYFDVDYYIKLKKEFSKNDYPYGIFL